MSRKVLAGVLVVAAFLLAARLAMPWVLEAWVNRVLDETRGYDGHVGDVDVALLRGAYTIEGLALRDTGGDVPVPLLSAPRVDLSVAWRALLRGEVVGEVVLERPEVNLVAAPSPQEQQTGMGAHWTERVAELFPVTINRFVVRDGTVHLRNFHTEPKVDVVLSGLQLTARNLSNVRDLERPRPASAVAQASLFDPGRVEAELRFDPLARHPDFHLDAAAEKVDLRDLNDFLRAYFGVDAQRGTLAVYTELDARDGRFEGYVKPLVEDLDVLHVEREGDEQGPLSTLWEALTGAAAEGLEAQGPDRQAARIPVEGRFENPDIGLFEAVESVLHNAFVEALQPGLGEALGREDGS